jgi:hypothetical protein
MNGSNERQDRPEELGNMHNHSCRLDGCRAAAAVLGLVLGACASTPREPVSERTDPDTATTVTVLNQPVELLAEAGKGNDPFAYLAPFETNRQGERSLFLWVATPESAGPKLQPQLLCDGQPVGLQPLEGDLTSLKLSKPPYSPPAPWSTQWYFRLPPDGLKCLATAQGVALETGASQGQPERFTAGAKSLASIEAFTRR